GPERGPRPARTGHWYLLVSPYPTQRSTHRPADGRRVALGRRLLPGQPGAHDRQRGAGERQRVCPLRRARVDRTFIGQLRFPNGLLAQFDCGFAAPDRERVEIVGSDAILVLDAPFLPEPDGPSPSVVTWRGRDSSPVEVPSLDQYLAEVEDLMSVILDGSEPRLTLASSRGNVATLVALDRAARAASPEFAASARA